MDLKQIKLSKSEWDSIEIPVTDKEKEVLTLIMNSHNDVNIKINKALLKKYNITNIRFEKAKTERATQNNKEIQTSTAIANNGEDKPGQLICYIDVNANVKLKTKDQIRINRVDSIDEKTSDIYEFILYNHFEQMMSERSDTNKHWMFQL